MAKKGGLSGLVISLASIAVIAIIVLAALRLGTFSRIIASARGD